MLNLTLPIYWTNQKVRVKSTTHLLGMNFYRNAHHHIQNKLKQEISELVYNQLDSPPKFTTFSTHYKLYYKNNACDPSNIVPLIEKVLLDALQHSEVIANDNVKFHLSSSWEVVGQDRDNPRCEITIKEHNELS